MFYTCSSDSIPDTCSNRFENKMVNKHLFVEYAEQIFKKGFF